MNKIYYDWNTAYDVSLEPNFSPGQALLGYIVKHFFEKRINVISFNFMRGDENYKKHWSNDCTANMSIYYEGD